VPEQDNDRKEMEVSLAEEKTILRWRSLRGRGASVLILAVSGEGEPAALGVLPFEPVGDIALLMDFVRGTG
jgi:hypothetical protein